LELGGIDSWKNDIELPAAADGMHVRMLLSSNCVYVVGSSVLIPGQVGMLPDPHQYPETVDPETVNPPCVGPPEWKPLVKRIHLQVNHPLQEM
jgi:hypothetical protein